MEVMLDAIKEHPIIMLAVLSLVDFGILKSTWRFSKLDFMAVATTLRDIDLVLKSVLGAAERCRMLFNRR